MNDLINRQDAINELYNINPSEDMLFVDAIVDMLENLPEKSEQKWIPVTEALPKPWQEVLTTYEYKGKRFVQTAEYAGQNDEKGHPLFCAYSDEFTPDHYDFVYVAWMPLPEPAIIGDMKMMKDLTGISEFENKKNYWDEYLWHNQ